MQKLRPGDAVGEDFEIIRSLGSGGMGSVYLGLQHSTHKVRAIKVMHDRFSKDTSFVERFEREARIGSRIQSDHVVDVVAAGIDPVRGLPWLAMEYLDGFTLTDAMSRFGPPGANDARIVTDHLWHAICAAHDANVVHRDLKPDNLFLAVAHSPGRPFELKVLDFGIAKWLHSRADNSTLRVLTHGWGAPEQAIPGAPLGAQADVWALGLVLFWLCTGHSFWHDPDNLDRVQVQVFNLPIPAASTRAGELGIGVAFTREFDAWFARCVTREPADRFENARAALRGWQALSVPWSTNASPWRAVALPFATTVVAGESTKAEPPRTSNETSDLPVERAPRFTSAPLELKRAPSSAARRSGPHGLLNRAWPALAGGVALVTAGVLLSRNEPSDAPAATTALQPTAPPPTTQSVPPGMLVVPAGELVVRLGDDSEAPPRRVRFTRPFALDEAEVTVASYDACLTSGACTPPKLVMPNDGASSLSSQYSQLCNASRTNRGQHPVNCVTRGQASAYCSFRDKRLPTEAEWEFAARGFEPRPFPWGQRPPRTCEEAVVNGLCRRLPDDAPTRPATERSSAANGPFGHVDLAGNVWEWVLATEAAQVVTPNRAMPPGSEINEVGILRGGAWDEPAEAAMTTSRRAFAMDSSDVNVGFRCALDL